MGVRFDSSTIVIERGTPMVELKPTCPQCGFQDDNRTKVVGHMIKEHGVPIGEAREKLVFKREQK